MTDLLLTITRVAVLLFLISSMSGMGLGLTLRQVIAVNFQGVLRIFGTGAIAAALLFAILSSILGMNLPHHKTKVVATVGR